METKIINHYSFTTKIRKTKRIRIINSKRYKVWEVAKRGDYLDYIEVEDGKFAMIWHDPCGWHIGEAYPEIA